MDDEDLNPLPLIRAKLAWDMLPANHDYWDVLDLVPPSEEISQDIQRESDRRMKLVEPFMPFIEMYSVLCADIMSSVIYKNQRTQLDESNDFQMGLLKQWHRALIHQNREILRGAMYPLLAAMMEAGVIQKGDPSELVG